MKKTQEVTCRYGVKYNVTFSGSKGEVWRAFDWMTRCCCWCCHNHDCQEPKDEILDDKECCELCSLFWKVRGCDKKPFNETWWRK